VAYPCFQTLPDEANSIQLPTAVHKTSVLINQHPPLKDENGNIKPIGHALVAVTLGNVSMGGAWRNSSVQMLRGQESSIESYGPVLIMAFTYPTGDLEDVSLRDWRYVVDYFRKR